MPRLNDVMRLAAAAVVVVVVAVVVTTRVEKRESGKKGFGLGLPEIRREIWGRTAS
jgi:hypothetical protein